MMSTGDEERLANEHDARIEEYEADGLAVAQDRDEWRQGRG